MTLMDATMLADIPTSYWALSETEKIATITAPTPDAGATVLPCKLGSLGEEISTNRDFVSRRKAGSELYSV